MQSSSSNEEGASFPSVWAPEAPLEYSCTHTGKPGPDKEMRNLTNPPTYCHLMNDSRCDQQENHTGKIKITGNDKSLLFLRH